ncbi:hypothetical protein ABZ128_27960 [Streptomyces sp. NPDC006326]|uniref:hypothetical protein n=1 Tax=Streptomyces sp. NPDC006326 TaxID=3156752 RepID=UPI0033B4A34C
MGSSENRIREGGIPAPRTEDTAEPERWRYARHLDALAAAAAAGAAAGAVAGAGRLEQAGAAYAAGDTAYAAADTAYAAEAAAVCAVLGDPDPVMAESAVVTHLDRRAAHLPAGARFAAWARAMAAVLDGRAFPARRLREWTLLKAITQGDPWSAAELTAASDWCQRTAAHALTSYEALSLLATAARTHRVRNTAARRLRRAAAA